VKAAAASQKKIQSQRAQLLLPTRRTSPSTGNRAVRAGMAKKWQKGQLLKSQDRGRFTFSQAILRSESRKKDY
jgi:hypothetical protein